LLLAALAAATSPIQLLEQVAQQVSTIELTQQRQELSAYSQLLAGLRFDKRLIRQIFQEGIMRESVIYQEILQEGELKGRQEGKDAGKLEEAQALVLRQLTRRIGNMSPAVQTQMRSLSLTQLENLGEALLDFSSPTDLANWLQNQ
jgi:predicted transposase YdaD